MTAVAPSSPVAGQPAPRLQKAFGRASEEPYRRRPSDVVRLVAAAAVLIVLVLQATNPPDATQVDVLLLFRSLPRGLVPLLRGLEDIGTLWMVGLLGAATLLARRWRLSRDLALSGSLAWAVSRVLGPDVVGRVGLGASLRALAHFGTTPNFPLVRLAVAVAVFATAAPYVSRPTRWLGAALVVILVVAGLYLGTSYPIDILGGLAVGWGIAAAVHLIFGSPGGRPSSGQIEAALPQIGIKARAVRLAREQSAGGTIFEGEDQVGPLVVKVIGRDDVDGQLLSKTWRSVAYKEPSPPLQLSRAHQVEHEACMTLLAGSAGVNVPEVVFVGEAGPGAGVLVTCPLGGQRLGELEAAAVSDDLLAGVWRMVAKLHTAGVAHGALDAGHVVVGNDGPGVVSFATATTADFGLRHAKDTAELLASTAHMVGDERAVAACIEGLGVPALVSAIPLIQPAALRPQTRSALSSHHRGVQKRVDELRNAAAAAAGVKAPELQKLQRFRPASVIMAASSLVAIAVLLDRVGPAANLWHIARHLQWDWAAVAVAVSLATNVPGAVAVMGTLPLRLPLWPTIELQLAMSYTNLVVPVVGGTALQIRFLQRQGSDLPTALAAGGLLSIVGSVLTRVPLLLWLWLSRPTSCTSGTSHLARSCSSYCCRSSSWAPWRAWSSGCHGGGGWRCHLSKRRG